MSSFVELKADEYVNVNGGGVASAVAGTLVGALVGTIVGIIPAAVAGDASVVGHAAITGASVGLWVGCGAPLP